MPLKIVAGLFILSGFLTIVQMALSIMHTGRTIFNIVSIAFLIGIGLLQSSAAARIAALIYLWITGLLTALIVIIHTFTPSWIVISGDLHNATSPVAVGIFYGFVAVLLFLTTWQYQVLTSPEVKALFRKPEA